MNSDTSVVDSSSPNSPFKVPPFDGRVPEPKNRFTWWAWHPNYPRWAKSCWGAPTIEEALALIETPHASGMDLYHKKLIREDNGGLLVEIADRPCKRIDIWQRIAEQRNTKQS